MFTITKISSPYIKFTRSFAKKKIKIETSLYNKIQLTKKFKQYMGVIDKYHYEQPQEIYEKDPELNILDDEVAKTLTDDRYNLTPHSYWLTKGKGNERPFTGDYWASKDVGSYECTSCSNKLFL